MKKIILKIKDFLNENEIYTFGKNHKTLIFMVIMIVGGMIFGAILAGCISFEVIDSLSGMFLNDFKERISQNLGESFVSSISVYFAFALLLELSALAVWGALSCPLILCFRGIGIGISGGYLYLIYGLKGIAFYVLILMPGIFVSSIAFALFGSASFKMSLKIAKSALPKGQEINFWQDMKLNFKRFGRCFLILCFSAFLDMCFMAMFSGFFDF